MACHISLPWIISNEQNKHNESPFFLSEIYMQLLYNFDKWIYPGNPHHITI